MKTVRIVLSPTAEAAYRILEQQAEKSKTARSLCNAIHHKAEVIKVNPHYGNPIAKHLIPAEYKYADGVTNLFRVELPQFWRMLYFLTNNGTKDEIIALIIAIIDHDAYDKKFDYQGK